VWGQREQNERGTRRKEIGGEKRRKEEGKVGSRTKLVV